MSGVQIFRICGFVSLTVLVASGGVHLATFVPSLQRRFLLAAMPLHGIAMILFILALASFFKFKQRERHKPANGHFASWQVTRHFNRELNSRLTECVSPILRGVCVTAIVYAFVGFAFFAVYSEGGSPTVRNGRYQLEAHGLKMRTLSEKEYDRSHAYFVRGFSGVWIALSLIAAVYFLTIHPQLHKRATEGRKGDAKKGIRKAPG